MECSICLDEIEKIDNDENSHLLAETVVKKYKNAKYLNCGHIFHKDCIEEWMKDNPCCPYCRKYFVNKIPCYVRKNNNRFRRRGAVFIEDENIKDVTLFVQNIMSKSYTLFLNRFNIISIQHNRDIIYVKCYKTLYNEIEHFQIFVDKKFQTHVFDSLSKVVKKHYISKSRITPSVVSKDENTLNNYSPPEENKLGICETNKVRILSSSSFSSVYSLKSIEL